MSLPEIRPLKRNVAVRILPELETGMIKSPDLPSGNQIAELLRAGPQADPELQAARWVLIPRYRPNLPPGDVVMLDSAEVLAVIEDYGST